LHTFVDERIDQFDDVLPFDNEELYLQNDLPSGTVSNRTFEDENLYEKLTACIENLDSVSDSETSDGTEKLSKPSVTENGINNILIQIQPRDDRVVAETLDEIVDRIVSVDGKNDQNFGTRNSMKKVSNGIGNDDHILPSTPEMVKKSETDSKQSNDDLMEQNRACVPLEHGLRSTLDQIGMDSTRLQNLIKTFLQHYEESTSKVSFFNYSFRV